MYQSAHLRASIEHALTCRDGRAAGPAGHVWASNLSPEDGSRVTVDLPEQVVDPG